MKTVIDHSIRTKLGISCDEYVFLDFIYTSKKKTYSPVDFNKLGFQLPVLKEIKKSILSKGLIEVSGPEIKVTDVWKRYFTVDNTPLIESIIKFLNITSNSEYKANSKKTIQVINARIADGFIYEDFVIVIKNRVDAWINDDEMKQYLRPETLFGGKFEGYLQTAKLSVKVKSINNNMQGMVM